MRLLPTGMDGRVMVKVAFDQNLATLENWSQTENASLFINLEFITLEFFKQR